MSVDDGLGSASGANQIPKQPPPSRFNPNTGRRNPGQRKPPQVRKVNDFIVFLDEVLGEG